MLYPNYEPEKGDMLSYGPSMATVCETCEYAFIDCENCHAAEARIMKAHTPKKEVNKNDSI